MTPHLPRWFPGLLLAVLSLGGSADPRAETVVPMRVGEEYRVVRQRLLAQGWKRQLRHEGGACSVLPGDRRCSLFPELASCAPTGLGLCRFDWRSPQGVPYAVITREGSPEGQAGRIERWFVSR